MFDVVTYALAKKNAGGGSSGGVLVVHETVDGKEHTLDKNYDEIMAAGFAVKRFSGIEGETYSVLVSSFGQVGEVFYVAFSDDPSAYYWAETSTGTLTYSSK